MTRICSVPSSNQDITQNRIYFDMLKIINLDIMIFNHIFDIFNGGEGLHAEFKKKQEGIQNGINEEKFSIQEKMQADFKKRK